MTTLQALTVPCSTCGKKYDITTQGSITTFLYPELVTKLLDNGFYFECFDCNSRTYLVYDILVNSFKGMFYISTGASFEEKKRLLIEYGVINEEGDILVQSRDTPKSEVKHDPRIAEQVDAVNKVIEEFIDNTLDKKEKSE
ncbi:MAG: CpXC domain-containing protein [Candidatus Heimdallarchaeota archaeon]